MSGNDGRRRGAHPQHRRGEETRVSGTRTGGREAPNGGRNAWMFGARTAAETCGHGGRTNSTEGERSEGDCELSRGPRGTKAVSLGQESPPPQQACRILVVNERGRGYNPPWERRTV